MCEFSDLIFKAQKELLKQIIEINCSVYNDNFHKIEKIYENNKLIGLCIYEDYEDKRIIYEFHYLGKNKYLSFKLWRKIFDKNKHILCSTLINNIKIINFLKKMGFREYKNNKTNIFLEFRRC